MTKERIIFEELERLLNKVTGGKYSQQDDCEVNGGDLVEAVVERVENLRTLLEKIT